MHQARMQRSNCSQGLPKAMASLLVAFNRVRKLCRKRFHRFQLLPQAIASIPIASSLVQELLGGAIASLLRFQSLPQGMVLLQVASTRFRTRLAWFELPDDRPTTCRRGRWVVGRPPYREHRHRTPPQTNLPRTDMHPPHTHHAHTDHTAPPPPLLSLARGRAGRGR
jgi:hypothetical protein